MRRFLPFSLFSVLLILSSTLMIALRCNLFDKSITPVIARVGKATLSIDDLNKAIPAEFSDKITIKQQVNYVKQWVDTELFYQEALRLKIEKEEIIKEQLCQMKKDLLGAEIITRHSKNITYKEISNEAIRIYYEQNKDSFIRETNVIKYVEIIVNNLKRGWAVRNMVTSTNFFDLANEYSTVPIKDPTNANFVSEHDLPSKIASVIFNIRVNGTTSPIQMDDGVHIFRIIDKQDAGKTALLEEVRNDIIDILSTRKQKQHVNNLLSDLRNKTDYEFNFELITLDSPNESKQSPQTQNVDITTKKDEKSTIY